MANRARRKASLRGDNPLRRVIVPSEHGLRAATCRMVTSNVPKPAQTVVTLVFCGRGALVALRPRNVRPDRVVHSSMGMSFFIAGVSAVARGSLMALYLLVGSASGEPDKHPKHTAAKKQPLSQWR